MKQILLLFMFMLGALNIMAQSVPVDPETGKVTFSEVYEVDSTLSKAELYSRAKEWISNTFKSSEAVIDLDDREGGKVFGNAWQNIYFGNNNTNPVKMFYSLKIHLKDGKYKLDITNIAFQQYPDQFAANPPKYNSEDIITDEAVSKARVKARTRYRELTWGAVNDLKDSLNKAMAKAPESDNW